MREELAAGDLEVDRVDRDDVAVGLPDPAQDDVGLERCRRGDRAVSHRSVCSCKRSRRRSIIVVRAAAARSVGHSRVAELEPQPGGSAPTRPTSRTSRRTPRRAVVAVVLRRAAEREPRPPGLVARVDGLAAHVRARGRGRGRLVQVTGRRGVRLPGEDVVEPAVHAARDAGRRRAASTRPSGRSRRAARRSRPAPGRPAAARRRRGG